MNILHYCRKFVIKLIQLYQKIAPYCGIRECCLFELSCSHYAIGVFKKYGLFKGLWKTILRLLACQNLIKAPWFENVKKI